MFWLCYLLHTRIYYIPYFVGYQSFSCQFWPDHFTVMTLKLSGSWQKEENMPEHPPGTLTSSRESMTGLHAWMAWPASRRRFRLYIRTRKSSSAFIHQTRNSTKYVSYKDLEKLMADLKKVYAAPDEQSVLANLDEFGERWDAEYPKISKSWSEH